MRRLYCFSIPLRRPIRLIPAAILVFFGLGTFYWEFWTIPWLSNVINDIRDDQPGNSNKNLWDVSAQYDPNGIPLRPNPINTSLCTQNTKEASSFKITSYSNAFKNRYCAWNTTLQDCYQTLMPTFHKQSKWVFLGDDGMANIPYYLSLQWPSDNLTITTRRNPCQNLIYYGFPPPDSGWRLPDLDKGEGPVERKESGEGNQYRPYCMDCANCWNVGMMSGQKETDLSVEYLVVEYARDVSVPSRLTATTQETAAHYLSQNPPSVCIASAGLKDAAIQPPISKEMYLINVDTYLGLLQRTCDNVIWISLHAVVEADDVVQTNCRLYEWKTAVLEQIEARNYDNVYVMDIWEKSFHADFYNPTRLGKKFYASLARLFKSIMVGPSF